MSLSTPPHSNQELYNYLSNVKLLVDFIEEKATFSDSDIEYIQSQVVRGGIGNTGVDGVDGVDGTGLPQTSPILIAITGLQVVNYRTFNLVSWDNPTEEYQHVTILRSDIDDISTANAYGAATVRLWADYTDTDKIYYYWIFALSKPSIEYPYGRPGLVNTDSPTISSTVDSKISLLNIDEYFETDVITAEYFAVTSLTSIKSILGDVTLGTLKNAISSPTFEIDLINGFIEISSLLISIENTSGTNGAWDASAYSTESYTNGCVARFTAGQTHSHVMTGLTTDPTASTGYTTIDFAIYFANGFIYTYENGVFGGVSYGSYTIPDIFEVYYNGTDVFYKKNGITFFTLSVILRCSKTRLSL